MNDNNVFSFGIVLFFKVKTELREMSPEELSSFIEDFHHDIYDMVSSNDLNEKKGGILAISMYLKHSYIYIIYIERQNRIR